MNRFVTTLSTAAGLAIALQAAPSIADDMNKPMDAMDKPKYEKCYGVAAAGKNDCAGGANSCAGHSTQARDPKAYIEVPVGLCAKIAGGKLTPG